MVRYHDPTAARRDREERRRSTGFRRRTVLGALAAAGVLGADSAAAERGNLALDADGTPKDVAAQEDDAPVGTDALLGYIEAKYGDQLEDDQLEDIRGRLAGILGAGEAVSDFELERAAEPAFAFQPYRGEE